MKSRVLKVPKLQKSKLQKQNPENPKSPKPKFKLIKKRKLLFLLVLIFLFLLLAGSGITEVLKDKIPGGEKTEAAEQGEETDKAEGAGDIDGAGNLEGHLASDFIQVLKSGEYAIRYKTTAVYEGQSYEVETTYAVSGGSIAMASGDRATVVREDKVYLLNHTDQSIISWDVNHAKGSPKRIDTEGVSYLGSREESGLVCEEYETPASHYQIYFKGSELMKMEARIDGEDMVMNILEVKKKAPGSLFEVPPDYRMTNL
jgi:hypothetical protein